MLRDYQIENKPHHSMRLGKLPSCFVETTPFFVNVEASETHYDFHRGSGMLKTALQNIDIPECIPLINRISDNRNSMTWSAGISMQVGRQSYSTFWCLILRYNGKSCVADHRRNHCCLLLVTCMWDGGFYATCDGRRPIKVNMDLTFGRSTSLLQYVDWDSIVRLRISWLSWAWRSAGILSLTDLSVMQQACISVGWVGCV